MKKFAAVIILVLFALMIMNIFSPSDMHVVFDDGEIDGPMGVLVGLFAGGVGLLIAGIVLAVVGVVLAAVFAGLGLLAVLGLGIGGVVLAIALSPLFAVPLAIVFFVVYRNKKNREKVAA